jgi:hypothetical protein
VRIDIHTNHINAIVGCHDGGGQADIAQAHETCFHLFLFVQEYDPCGRTS